MANNRHSYLATVVDVFTAMMNTPLVEPEPTVTPSRPTAIPMKTFSETSRRASSETYQESTASSSSSTSMRHSWGPKSSSVDSIPSNSGVKELK
ncbi:hypothetical protein BDN70DRAFT_870774 [Pholiota conissans]|uniref:Uncharacterized protein n=1 Tax=Pholiota conissans TaxID=109636 RepID=A0A9P5ZG90_9AGAR|nr:hypothetical protein BDN70DRAFT_870774 [Pholiota conissans]